ncbi:glycosyltransferase [Adhaeribacter sp. BT258]|uniref:Glycosyltransferase n=1 Tax=Adhaeribacter terrigena TaxID=2793070 RepID=A0ABS1BXB9_9BACT|nr:glycosyltransferase [Adhaeribacter terrigena]MBK0401724.1 glycosyltransferase [Adhaeribacter terrigena]
MAVKRNVLVLVEFFGQGGAERVGAMVAQMLADSGKYNVWLYAIQGGDITSTLAGVTSGSLNILNEPGSLKKVRNYYLKFARLSKLKKQLNIDLSISSLWPVDWINALTGSDKKVAIIQINILNNVQNEKMVRFRKLVSTVYSRFDKIVLGGGNLVPEMTDFFKINGEKLLVIQNPVETKRVEKNLREPLPFGLSTTFDKYQVLVAANRLSAIKNTQALIYIYKLLTDKEKVKILIIGEGEEKERLQQLIINEGFTYSQVESESFDENSNFYFLNFQNNIHNLIGTSKVFLFPTKAEGLPLTLLEAMSTGVPVLVSDCPNGGVGEIINGTYDFDFSNQRSEPAKFDGGYLMPIPHTDKAEQLVFWKGKIEEILAADNPRRESYRFSNKARAEKFDVEHVKFTWVSMIEGLFTN